MRSAEGPQVGATGIATENEAFRFLSDVMRGALTEPGGKPVSVGDRLKACSGLLKLFEIHEEKSSAGERELALAAAAERIGQSIAPGFGPVLGDVLVHGHTHQVIAARLNVSVKTVETYRARIREKTGLKSRADLVRYGLATGLLAADPGA